MTQRFTTKTFETLSNSMIGTSLTNEVMDRQFELIQKNFEEGHLYHICRKIWNYFLIIKELNRSNAYLVEENKRLRNELKAIKATKTVVKTVVTSETWIDNGQPGDDWRTIHEMGC